MKPRKNQVTTLLVVLMGGVMLGTLHGQSLADLARQQRARKGPVRQTGKVFTNDDVSRSAPAPAAPSTAESPQAGEESQAGTAATAAAPETETAESRRKAREQLEQEYRAKFAELRKQLSIEEKQADVLQRELNLMQMQYYSDPNVTMRQEYTRNNINKRVQEIEDQKAVVEKARQAIADLEQELRRKRLPIGWAR